MNLFNSALEPHENFNFLIQHKYFKESRVEDCGFPELKSYNIDTLLHRDLPRIKKDKNEGKIPFLTGGRENVRLMIEGILTKLGYQPLQKANIPNFALCLKNQEWWIHSRELRKAAMVSYNSCPLSTAFGDSFARPVESRTHRYSAPPCYYELTPPPSASPVSVVSLSESTHGLPIEPQLDIWDELVELPEDLQFNMDEDFVRSPPLVHMQPRAQADAQLHAQLHAHVQHQQVHVLQPQAPVQSHMWTHSYAPQPSEAVRPPLHAHQLAAQKPLQPIKYSVIRKFSELQQILPHTQVIIEFYSNSFFYSYKECQIVEYLKENRKWKEDNEAKLWLEELIEESLLELLEGKDRIWVIATRGIAIIGLVIIDIQPSGEYYLAHYVVHPQFQGEADMHGLTLAQNLANQALTQLPKGSILFGFVRKMNVRALNFYRKMGAECANWEGVVEHNNHTEYHKYIFVVP